MLLLLVEDGSDILQGIVHEAEMLFYFHSVFLPACHRQDTCCSRFRRIPQIALYQQGFRMRQIQLSYLQIAPVEEPGVAGCCPIDGDLLLEAPSLRVVAAGDSSPAILAGEDDGAVVSVVGDFPDAR